jgi:hypothetical protein
MGLTKEQKARREARILRELEKPAKPVILTEARELLELFDEMRPIEDLLDQKREPGEYLCSAREAEGYWNVRPSAALRRIIDGMMKDVGLHFEIVIRDSDTALITATYDQILGSRWIAIIDAAKVRTACRKHLKREE